ncbi:MAG TPA: glycosyltransferase [Proteobacteria bacterium]|nr:glycosyltransferase [Pseudomonadota bacterium]
MNLFEEDMARGEKLFQAGKLEEARILFEQIVQLNPLHHEAMNNLGTVLYRQGDRLLAEHYYQKAFSLNEDDVDVLSNLADLYLNLKRWREAASFLERYLHHNPQDYERLNQLALAYMESGEHQKAIPILERSLEMQPNQEDIRNTLDTLKPPSSVKSCPVSRQPVPQISVGLAVYNGGKLLPQAIESILAQDFGDFELIISDNCSTDQTEKVCLHYQSMDRRIRYSRFGENLGMLANFLNVLGLATAPSFMFASHDDLREKTFMSACLPLLNKDPSVALVYPRAKVLDANSHFLGIAQDRLLADQKSPQERFKHLIWEIGMCNAFYGIFRLSILKKVTSWGKCLFGDNLALAEIALLGKIVQIDEPLFIRRLTRNYNYRSYDERNTQLMSEGDPKLFSEGISFPHSRLAYGHLELVNQSGMDDSDKDALMKEVLNCFRTRFGSQMAYEIDRAIALINSGHFYYHWNQKGPVKDSLSGTKALMPFHISGLLKRLQEALFFFPEREDLAAAYRKCCDELSKLHPTTHDDSPVWS